MRFAIRSSVFIFLFASLCALAQPTISPDQTRNVLSSAALNANVGSPIFAFGADPVVNWTLVSQTNPAIAGINANEVFFSINAAGQITVFKDLSVFFPASNPDPQVTVTLSLTATDDMGITSAAEDVTITIAENVIIPIIAGSQVRTVLVTAEVDSAAGNPINATGDPDSWEIVSEDNHFSGVIANVDADEIFFEISTGGQLTVKQELTRFFAEFRDMARGESINIQLTLRAYKEGTPSSQETVIITIEEGTTPVIYGAQDFTVTTAAEPGTDVGTLSTIGNPTNFSIVGGSGFPAGASASNVFSISETGVLSTTVWLDQYEWLTNPTNVTVQVVASNILETSPVVDVTVTVIPVATFRCGLITATQTRYISSVAATGEGAGFPIDTHNIDSIWIQAAWIGTNPAGPFEDVATYFTIETNGGTFGQIKVVRDLSAFFDPEVITLVTFQVRGHALIDACPEFIDEFVYLYVLPADAGDTGSEGDGGGDGGTGTGVDFFNYITDANLETCIRNTLGLVGTQALSAADVLGLSNLNCGCIPGGTPAIGNISGLHLFTSLSSLNLSNNMISDIRPLSNLTGLTDLRLSGNMISDITTSNPLASLVNLQTLDLSANQIEDTNAFSTLLNLDFLDLSSNEICEIASLIPLVENGFLAQGDTVDLENNHLLNVEGQSQIAALESAGVFVPTAGNDACPTTFVPLRLIDWPVIDVRDLSDHVSLRQVAPCN